MAPGLVLIPIPSAFFSTAFHRKVQEHRRTHDLMAAFDVGHDDHLSSKDFIWGRYCTFKAEDGCIIHDSDLHVLPIPTSSMLFHDVPAFYGHFMENKFNGSLRRTFRRKSFEASQRQRISCANSTAKGAGVSPSGKRRGCEPGAFHCYDFYAKTWVAAGCHMF